MASSTGGEMERHGRDQYHCRPRGAVAGEPSAASRAVLAPLVVTLDAALGLRTGGEAGVLRLGVARWKLTLSLWSAAVGAPGG